VHGAFFSPVNEKVVRNTPAGGNPVSKEELAKDLRKEHFHFGSGKGFMSTSKL